MFSPELNEMYARERQHDYRQEAADAARARQASASGPRLSAYLAARLGRWFRQPQPRMAPAARPRQSRV